MHWSDQNYSKALVENGFSQGDIGSFDTYLNKGSAVVRDIVLLTEEKEIQNSRSELEQIDQKNAAVPGCSEGKLPDAGRTVADCSY